MTVVKGTRLRVDTYARHTSQQLLIHLLHMLVVVDMLIEHGHLSTTDAGADVRHAVVVANGLMLIVRIGLAGLGGQPHDLLPSLLVGADECAAARGGDHLVAVEGEHAVAAEGAQHLSLPAATEAFGGVFDDGDVVFRGDLHDTVDVVGHAIERHGHDGLGLTACLGDAVADGLLHQLGVDVPRVLLAVDEDGCRAEVGNGVGRGAEGERLHDDLVARPHAAGD